MIDCSKTLVETAIETQVETAIETTVETQVETAIETQVETAIETAVETQVELLCKEITEYLNNINLNDINLNNIDSKNTTDPITADTQNPISNPIKDQKDQKNIISLTSSIFHLIFITPNFKRQVSLIDKILSLTPLSFHKIILHFVILNFKNIPFDRKDKFFYLIKKTFHLVSFNYITNIKDREIQCHLWKTLISDKNIITDWNDHTFLDFILKSESYLIDCIGKFKIDEDLIREYLNMKMTVRQREYLYSLIN